MYNRSWVTSKCMNYRRSQNYRTTEGTLHEIDFYLILTLGSRNGLGYSVALWYSIKKDNNNNNNNNNDNNNNNNINIVITILIIIIIIIITAVVVVVVLIRFCKILLVVVLIHNHLPAKGKRW